MYKIKVANLVVSDESIIEKALSSFFGMYKKVDLLLGIGYNEKDCELVTVTTFDISYKYRNGGVIHLDGIWYIVFGMATNVRMYNLRPNCLDGKKEGVLSVIKDLGVTCSKHIPSLLKSRHKTGFYGDFKEIYTGSALDFSHYMQGFDKAMLEFKEDEFMESCVKSLDLF
jgi:hypothetical protein